jgi:hypothetical protein
MVSTLVAMPQDQEMEALCVSAALFEAHDRAMGDHS